MTSLSERAAKLRREKWEESRFTGTSVADPPISRYDRLDGGAIVEKLKRSNRRRSLFPIASMALALACAMLFSRGALPASAQPQNAASSPAASLTPPPAQSPRAPAWAAFERAWADISSYNATITTFEQEGAQVQNWVFDYTFHKPSSATAHYNTGPNAGVTAVWNGGDTVVAHRGGGFLALFKRTFALHDPIVTTIRGSSIDQLSFGAILAHGNGTAGTISESPGPTILSVPTASVTLVPSAPAADAGLTEEVIDISTLTNLPIRVLGYDGATLVRQVDFSNVRIER
jgi:hypothetical protein